MEYLLEQITAWICLKQCDLKIASFSNTVFHFIKLALQMPSSPKLADYKRTLETFRVQYYNEFMFKVVERTSQCQTFVDTLDEFFKKPKCNKKDYTVLFQTLATFYTGSVGGSFNNKPLLTDNLNTLVKNKPLAMLWNYDQVHQIRKDIGMIPGKCSVCNTHKGSEILFGTQMCLAACLPLCPNCKPDHQAITSYLEKCKPYLLPRPPDVLKKHWDESVKIWNELAKGPSQSLENTKVAVQAHGKHLVQENRAMIRQISDLKQGLRDMEIQYQHAIDEMNEYRISVRNEQNAREQCERMVYQGERVFAELKKHHEYLMRESTDLKQKLNESIQAQWVYYNKLKELQII